MPGYEVTLVDPPTPGFLCRECSLLLRDPVQTEDGERLCRSCRDLIKKTGVSKSEIKPEVQCYPDRAADREIQMLLVKCYNHKNGCTWQGELKALEGHSRELCDYQLQQRSNTGCDQAGESMPCSLQVHPLEEHATRRHNRETFERQSGKFHQTMSKAKGRASIQNDYAKGIDSERKGKQQGHRIVTHDGLLQRPTENYSPESKLKMLEKKVGDLERQTSTLKVQVSELQLLASQASGSFLWRIPEVARRHREAREEQIISLYSPPFYTGRNGYKMCIRAYLNGDGIGYNTHLSVFFVVMRGEFDPLLKWPFDCKVSLILVDQELRKHIVQTFQPTPESSSFQRPVTDMNVASGCPQFVKLSVLDDANCKYTNEDVIYLKCIVDTSEIFHP